MRQIVSKETLANNWDELGKRIQATWDWEVHPRIEIECRPAKSRRSPDQNALFWKWMEELSWYFSKRGNALTKDDAHDLMCHTFLGYEEKTIGRTLVTKMRTTSKLSVEEFSEFLDKIDAWAADKGCYLPTPADSAHEAWQQKQKQAGAR